MFATPVYTIMAVALFFAGTGVCRDTVEEAPLANIPFPELVMAFRELRTIKGHFDGGPWRNEVDRWVGGKHRVMEALRQRIDARGFGRPQLVEQLKEEDGNHEKMDHFAGGLWHGLRSAIVGHGIRRGPSGPCTG